jgi:hypothetical protein
MPLYAKNVLGLGPDKLGLMMGISAIGGLTGAVGLLVVPHEKRRLLMLGAVVEIALALVSLSRARGFLLAAGSLIFLSLGVSTLAGLTNTIVQERAPGSMRGRVSAIVGLCFFGLMPFAGLGIPSVADRIGIRNALLLSGVFFFVFAMPVLLLAGRFLHHDNAPNTGGSVEPVALP